MNPCPEIGIEYSAAQAQAPLSAPAFHVISLPDGSVWCTQHRVNGAYLLRFPGLADFSVAADGTHVVCTGVPQVDAPTLEHLLLNQVLPLARSRQGQLVLHASAVVVDGHAIAFIGVSGRGKSTLAAAFATRGYPFLTDDGLLVRQSADRALALPGPASLRLWDDSRAALVAEPPDAATPVLYTSKLRLRADGKLVQHQHASPLAALYFLGEADVGRFAVSPLGGQDALLGLLQHCFALDTDSRPLPEATFTAAAQLVQTVPSWQLEYPRCFEALPQMVATIVTHVAATGARLQNS